MADAHAHPAVLEALESQPLVSEFLERAVAEDRVNHAYLFVGPAGSGQMTAAKALASMVLCDEGGCGTCDTCGTVERLTHPDVRALSPGSAVGYLSDQVSFLIEDAQMAPMKGSSKVYIVQAADRLRDKAANALLKTIEEPPAGVIFIFMAPSLESVLPTIVSRCQPVPFRAVPPTQAQAMVRARTGVGDDQAAIALAVAGTPEGAVAYLRDPAAVGRRAAMVEALGSLASSTPWEVLQRAQAMAETAKDGQDELVKEHEKDMEQVADFLSRGALKEREKAFKRELRARERSSIMELIAAGESVMRDVLVTLSDAGQPPVNTDAAAALGALTARLDVAGALRCLEVLARGREDVVHNVTPRLALEVMLLSLKEELCPPSSR